MILHGCGLGASLVGGFSDAHKSAIMGGLPDTIDTYAIVSSLWTSVFALGAFVGPVAGGFLFDAVTFRWAIFMVIIPELFSLVTIVAYICLFSSAVSGTNQPDPLPMGPRRGSLVII